MKQRTYTRHTKQIWGKSIPLKDGITEHFNLMGLQPGQLIIECSYMDGKEIFRVKAYSDSMGCLVEYSDILLQIGELDEQPNIADKIEDVLIDNGVNKYGKDIK